MSETLAEELKAKLREANIQAYASYDKIVADVQEQCQTALEAAKTICTETRKQAFDVYVQALRDNGLYELADTMRWSG